MQHGEIHLRAHLHIFKISSIHVSAPDGPCAETAHLHRPAHCRRSGPPATVRDKNDRIDSAPFDCNGVLICKGTRRHEQQSKLEGNAAGDHQPT